LNLVPGEIGVEYKTSDHSICAKVHSVKQAESIRCASLRRPMGAFDKHCLFVYGDNSRKVNYTVWTNKTLGYDVTDWRLRTTWFQSDLVRRSIGGDAAFETFLMACPMLDKKGNPVRPHVPPATDTYRDQPLEQSSPADPDDSSESDSPVPVSPVSNDHMTDAEDP
jgi:hypothetical protein